MENKNKTSEDLVPESERQIDQRHPDKDILFVGVQNPEVSKKIKEMFPDYKVHIMNKDIFNRNVSMEIQRIVKWEEDQQVNEYVSKPENIQSGIEICSKLQEKVGTEWFVVDDLVDNTNFTYKQARNTIDLMFAFGFIAIDNTFPKKPKFLIIVDPLKKLEHVRNIRNNIQKELDMIDKIINDMESQLEKSKDLPATKPVRKRAPAKKSSDKQG